MTKANIKTQTKTLTYPTNKWSRQLFHNVSTKALVDTLADDGLVVYCRLSKEDLAQETGVPVDEIQSMGKYVNGFYVGDFSWRTSDDYLELRVDQEVHKVKIPYMAIMAVSYGNTGQIVQPFDGEVDDKPAGYDELFSSAGAKDLEASEVSLPDNVIRLPVHTTLQ